MSIEAMKQVLLNEIDLVLTDPETILSYGAKRALQYVEHQLQAIAEAEKQEPVAYGHWDTMLGKGNRMMMVRLDKGQDGCTVPLYTSPPQRQQDHTEDNLAMVQEPVAWPETPSEISDMIGSNFVWREHEISDVEPHENDKYCVTAHDLLEAIERWFEHAAPPQRQPLTDEQRREIAHRWRDGNGTASEIIDMVEAAHGIKE